MSREYRDIDGELCIKSPLTNEFTAIVEADAVDKVTFEDGAESIGDFIEIHSDGSSYFVYGIGNASSSITVGEL